MSKFKVHSMAELMDLPETDCLVEDLRFIAQLIENHQLDRAAWRLADAGAELRRRLERKGAKRVYGLNMRTDRGAILPRWKIEANKRKQFPIPLVPLPSH